MAQMDKSLSEQQIHVSASIFCIGRKNWPYPPTASGSYGTEGGTEAGRLADEMWVGFETFRILYRLNYLGSYCVCYHSNVTIVLEWHFSQLLSTNAYFKVCF